MLGEAFDGGGEILRADLELMREVGWEAPAGTSGLWTAGMLDGIDHQRHVDVGLHYEGDEVIIEPTEQVLSHRSIGDVGRRKAPHGFVGQHQVDDVFHASEFFQDRDDRSSMTLLLAGSSRTHLQKEAR